MIKKTASGSVVALAGAVLLAVPVHAAPGDFGAIGYSPPDNTYAVVNHVASKKAAQSGAISACQDKGGTKCDWAVWNQDGCGALLVDEDGDWAGGAGATVKAAIQNAISVAQKNDVQIDTTKPLASFCTNDDE